MDVLARLGPLAKNGDESFTHALLAGSPALDTGLNSLAVDENSQPLTTDQRGAGFSRIFGTAVDIGAFEAGNPLNLTVDNTGDNGSLSACTSAAGDCSLRGAISRANSLTGNDTITFDPSVFAASQTITLGGSELIIADNGSLTLDGINGLRISGNNSSRIFTVNVGAVVNFNNLTLNGGGNVADGGTFVATLPNGNQNVGYNFTLFPNNLDYGYTVTSGSLPPGLSLTNSFAPTAVVAISGTPTQSGTFNFAITVTNSVNSNVTNYSLNVLAPTAASVTVSGRILTNTAEVCEMQS